MKKKHFLKLMALAFCAELISGCAIPQTVPQVRADAAHSGFYDTAHFVVDRPYVDVARTFQKETGRCLDVRINLVERSEPYGPATSRSAEIYRPKLSVLRTKLALSVQMRQVGPGIFPYDMPKHGYYYLVLDASRFGRRKTVIDMYYAKHGDGPLIRAVRGWVTGRAIGCPDLAN